MYAIIESGGHQFRAETGAVLSVPKIEAEVGATVVLDPVLLFSSGSDIVVGTPNVSGVTVRAEIVAHGKDDKVYTFKMKKRKNSRRIRGHRQDFTKVRITEIAAA
ncbi:MAG: 50S ribosomal protein L21 [bacterium]